MPLSQCLGIDEPSITDHRVGSVNWPVKGHIVVHGEYTEV